MPNSLWDMFQPQDAAGQPTDLGGALTGRSNSLIGLGMGLLSPSNPLRGQSSWGQGLEGFQSGAQLDARTAAAAAQLKQHRADQARAQANADRAFNREPEALRIMRATGVDPASPEGRALIYPKTDEWKEGKVTHREQDYPYRANLRTGQYEWGPMGAPPGVGAARSAPATDPYAGGAAVPFVGGGGVPSSSGEFPPPAVSAPSAAAQSAGVPAPLSGMEQELPSVQKAIRIKQLEEATKRADKDQAEQERNKKQAGMIDPVKEDIAQAIKIIETNPNSTTGLYGSMASKFGGQAGDLSGLLTTIKARISFDELQKMRQASPTGGALGNVSDKDMAALQAVEGSIEQSRTPGQLLFNLERLDRMRHEVIHGPGTAPPPKYAPPDPSGASARKTAPPSVKPGYIDPDYPDKVFKGGNPRDPNSWTTINRSGK